MKPLKLAMIAALLTLSTAKAHAIHFCINNTLDIPVMYTLSADINVTRAMDPDGFDKVVREVATGRDIDPNNPQWDCDDDFYLDFGGIYLCHIHGFSFTMNGHFRSAWIPKHTKICMDSGDHEFNNLPFKYQQGKTSLNINPNNGQSFDTSDLDNNTVIVHGTPFWWLDPQIPRFRIDTHSLSGRQ